MKKLLFIFILLFCTNVWAGDFITYNSDGIITGKYISKSDHLFYEGDMGTFIKMDRKEIRRLDRFNRVDILTQKIYRLKDIEIISIIDKEQAEADKILTLEKLKNILITKGVLNEEDF